MLEEVGLEFKVTRERARQIEAKALRKIALSQWSRKLKHFWNNMYVLFLPLDWVNRRKW